MGCCCSCTRELVSKKKKRLRIGAAHEETFPVPPGGVDLDLTQIHANIVCMGFPSTGLESLYRNPYSEVLEFLDLRFGEKYFVYNLCCEKSHQYDQSSRFHGRVAAFPFPDHHACSLEMIPDFVTHACSFLDSQGPDSVVAVHCKAGKGRTGLLACCLLMKLDPAFNGNPDSVVEFYGLARTKDGRGLTIPSQIRYVHYYGSLLEHSNGQVPKVVPTLQFNVIHLKGISKELKGMTSLVFTKSCLGKDQRVLTIPLTSTPKKKKGEPQVRVSIEGREQGNQDEAVKGMVVIYNTETGDVSIDATRCSFFHQVQGDVNIKIYDTGDSRKWSCALGFHTLFVKPFYAAKELDRLYKSKLLPGDAGIRFDFVEGGSVGLTMMPDDDSNRGGGGADGLSGDPCTDGVNTAHEPI